jgi:Flp pilus assembly pilin Flp
MINSIRNFVIDESGQDVVEYSLLLVLIGAAALFVMTTMGASIKNVFSKIAIKLSQADSSIS